MRSSHVTMNASSDSIEIAASDRVFVLTGAGISAESGLRTFRDSNGLWAGYRVEEVATPEGWDANHELVWQFYSQRRREAQASLPNAAHYALAELEKQIGDRFFLCTQNVDDLHERAGSRNLVHMHGELFKSRCEANCGAAILEDSHSYNFRRRNSHLHLRIAFAATHRMVRRDSPGDDAHPAGD